MRKLLIVLVIAGLGSLAQAAELGVGPGEKFARIEEAYAAAQPGDTIVVHPLAGGKAYEKVALQIHKAKLTIRAASDKPGERVKLSGVGFDYSGEGPVPRAMIQFDPDASGCVVEGFELSGAHNNSHNGSGFRINQANDVTIRGCDIHDNDMGIMSGGNDTLKAGANQLIESCLVHDNGDLTDPGYNHNFYLGGESATIRGCEVYASKTGHNIKSRCHLTRIEWCYIHDSANREIDLVDNADTDVPGSDALLIGNIIVKKQPIDGNKTTIHFGQDGKHERQGTIYLINNTIVTPYASPVVDLSSKTRACLANNLICDGGSNQQGQQVVGGKSFTPDAVTATHNYFTAHFAKADGTVGFASPGSTIAASRAGPRFVDVNAGDYHLAQGDAALIKAGLGWKDLLPAAGVLPADRAERVEILQFARPTDWPATELRVRKDMDQPTIGAYEFRR